MRIAMLATVIWFCGSLAGFAQPALEKLEQQLKQGTRTPPPIAVDPNPAAREPGYLGVITDDRQDQGRGVRVVDVLPDGPGAKAGLLAGDLVKQVNNLAIHQMADMAKIIELATVGDAATFVIDRGGEERKLTVTFGKRPPPGQRKFEAFGKIPGPVNELPAPTTVTPPKPGPMPAEAAPQASAPPPRLPRDATNDGARIELLERRVAELEQRLRDLERILRSPVGR